jgi:oxysterol-binding protein-related protein 8
MEPNLISGRLKLGKETLATIDGFWDGEIKIKDRRTGVRVIFHFYFLTQKMA